MSAAGPLTLLCLASYEKGGRFLEEAKRQGCRVYLLTSLSLKDTAKWPAGATDEIFYMPDDEHEWNSLHTLHAVAHLCRTHAIDRIVALDDFDLEKAAHLREHLRLPGLGETATRFFRDKLAMRMRAAAAGIAVPEFTAAINYEKIHQYLQTVPGPWVVKPRLMAGALGIKECHSVQEVWEKIHSAGDQQSFYLVERFIPGGIFHVDSIWSGGRMVYAIASAYGTPPLEVSQEGGIFTTSLLERGSAIARQLTGMNEQVLSAFELRDGVSHTEFIQARDGGRLYFLETSARVGGAHISDLIEAATGINMWSEWAKVETASARGESYQPPLPRDDYAGLLVSLARQELPDTSGFDDAEVVWRMEKQYHLGMIVKSESRERVEQLLAEYAGRARRDFHASAPAQERARD